MTTEEIAEAQAREVLFPEEINTTEGIVNLPKVRYD